MTSNTRISRRRIAMGAMLAPLLPRPALAQGGAEPYPAKPIRLLVGFAVGGGTDVMARIVAQRIGDLLGQPVVVDNRPGANGNIAAELTAKAPPDGYTLFYNTSALVISPSLYAKTGYDLERDFTPVGGTTNVAIVLVTAPRLGVHSIGEFVQLVKSRQGQLTYASSSNGNITHLASLLFQQATGFRAVHVPYKSETPAITDVASGQVDFMLGTVPGLLPLIRDGRLVPLGVGTRQRISALPNIPTFDETVAKGLEIGAWSGIVAPSGIRPGQVARLNDCIRKVLEEKTVLAGLSNQGAIAQFLDAPAYKGYLHAELKKWEKVIRDNKVRID